MRVLFLSVFLVGCAPVKIIRIDSNADSFVNMNGEKVCSTTKNCKIRIGCEDSTQKNFIIINKKNYFPKYFSLNGTLFTKDTSVFVMF